MGTTEPNGSLPILEDVHEALFSMEIVDARGARTTLTLSIESEDGDDLSWTVCAAVPKETPASGALGGGETIRFKVSGETEGLRSPVP